MAQLMTQIEVLTKHVMGTPTQKVNIVATNEQRYRLEDTFHTFDEDTHYFHNQMGDFPQNY